MSDRQLFVYVDLQREPLFVGRLWSRVRKGRESATFEYDDAWLKHPQRFALEPALALGRGPQHTQAGRLIFGAIGDSAPDRWGRVLIQREERRKARAENRQPRSLFEADYLLAVGDLARQGALRFCEAEGGPFLASQTNIPPLIRLAELLGAAMRVDADDASDEDLKLLLAPGSSLGGARPKASIIDRDGHLAIAKFPKHDDEIAVSPWEATALSLAAKAGITTTEWRLENVAKREVLILRRFDRRNGQRIPFLSAMSMLDAADGDQHSYLEIADAIRQYGASAEEDCAQLWRRVVFNILISNTDDHLRNHGFLYDSAGGWRLAPAYDLNPVPADIRPRILTTAIDEEDGTASLELALETADHYKLKPNAARIIVREVGAAVATWRDEAHTLGISKTAIERMASAFEHEGLNHATA
ncbi:MULTISPECIES: type II toxin-antitoxin system HipA family toxin [unclassified Bradyrhizobium]|uniref:type II toxin-antitoxin system HipA family toxin n=1 Tax=unclassified Bradyrhizobium TaxID=2631580 RepID=UPI0028E29F23|nr:MULTISPECIES: type II toxin-antitoxin system HipA family toxin [unclassified Bradyrhizobium]